MIHEHHRWLSPPLSSWQNPAFNVAAMTAVFQHSEENVIMAVSNRYNAGSKEWVVSSREKEKRYLDKVQDRCHIYVF